MVEKGNTIKLDCKKKTTKGKVFAVTNSSKPSDVILDILKKHKVTSFTPMHSSYKFCVIATGEFDFYAAKEERMSGIMLLAMLLQKMPGQL